MKTEDIMKQTIVQYYGNVRYRQPLKDVTLYDWLTLYSHTMKDCIENIRDINKYDEVTAKQLKIDKLPCITLSAYFNGYRNKSNIRYYNSVICIDIDKADNEHITDWEETKLRIMQLPFVMYSSLSCRGEGIFCLVYYDTTKSFIKVWNSLERDFREIGINIDEACKDETRLRFISYDDKAYIRKEVEIYDNEYDKPEQTLTYTTDVTFNEDDYFTYKAIYYLIKECGYRSNTYNTWLLDAFRLSTLADYGKVLFMYLSQCSKGYNEAAALDKFSEAVRTNRMDKICLTHYFGKLKTKLGNNWKQIINEYTIDSNANNK